MWHFVWRELYEPSISTVTCILPLAETSLPKQGDFHLSGIFRNVADIIWCRHGLMPPPKCSNEIRYPLQCLTVRPWKFTHCKTEVMEVQKGCVWKVATIEGTQSSLPWLWEGYVKLLGSKNCWAENPLMTHAVPGRREAVCFIEAFPRLKDLNVFKGSQLSLDHMAKPLPCYYPPVN